MIITELSGGLGNQMFQYATGRVLSIKNNSPLILDTRSYESRVKGDTVRQYELSSFPIAASIASQKQINEFFPTKLQKVVANITGLSLTKSIEIVKENGHDYDIDLLEKKGNIYLSGFWQTEKYFLDYSSVIKADFTFTNRLRSNIYSLANQIKHTNSVSVHIRRGDYVSNANANKFHGLMPVSYYLRAINKISKMISDPVFFIFSDDPVWVKANIDFGENSYFVSGKTTKNNKEDLYLMSLCQHHIIANSSFSWWGAWLGNHNGNVTIAPKNWFAEKSVDTSNILPSRWIKI